MKKDDVLDATKPSKDEIDYINWGKETFKENIQIINDIFKLLITVNVSLFSIYCGFYKILSIRPLWLKILPASLIIISLVISIIGVYPWPIRVDLRRPYEIRNYKLKKATIKGLYLFIAAIVLRAPSRRR